MISNRLLIDKAEVRSVTGMDIDRKPTFGATVFLEKIRIDAKALVSVTDKGYQRADTAILFFDCHNSKAFTKTYINNGDEIIEIKNAVAFVPAKGMKVKHNEINYEIRGVKPCKAQGTDTVHHFECDLV